VSVFEPSPVVWEETCSHERGKGYMPTLTVLANLLF
jgi:hypothetical protein